MFHSLFQALLRKQHCQFGSQYFKGRTPSSGQTCLQGSCKIGCLAHVHVHELTLFPPFSVPNAKQEFHWALSERKEKNNNDKIEEALKVIASWNPDWNPPYFMTDYSDAEIMAIEPVFPSCKVYLCDFHQEQAWERWIKDKSHGLSLAEGEILMRMLRKCTWAEPAKYGKTEDHSMS